MRPNLAALAIAAASFVFTAPGHAGTSYGEGYYGHYQQTCITKRIRMENPYGKTITKRVRICQ
ncbi:MULTISPECIES: hypothetical protein [unclassified Shinella]|jgi:hypothetical protein|uniref:hypothetical protein n=1 Tax=unclassified Shinella TaxID=2643062 RepID=UPI00234ED590|nr:MULTISPECIES: hypothetical protein [unclassified Shinella]MCO5153312.1 hypothetical protein [Shinella sp.]MDC7260490.1 hypothetical protein [Shinella sp. HY16]MDC7267385.1 hypothetical protein [Shinella sp. YZ44]